MAACWARFQSDINEGLDQTDAQIFGKSKYKKVRDMAFIKYNPLYWLTLLLSVPFFVLGRWVHLTCGQGDRVRDDETETEYEVRAVWVYGSDSFFFIGLVYATVMAISELADGAFQGANVAAFAINLAIYGGFIFTNTLLLRAMRRRDALMMKMQIAGTCAFASATIVLMAITLIGVVGNYADGGDRNASDSLLGWIFRCILVLFYAAMATTYSRLWGAYDDLAPRPLNEVAEKDGSDKGLVPLAPHSTRDKICMVLLASFASFTVTTLVVVMFLVDPSAFWEATTL